LYSLIKMNEFRFNYPLLTLMSLQNSLIDFNDSFLFHQKVQSKHKAYKAFQNGYHNIYDDNEGDEAKNFIMKWCNERLQTSKDFSNFLFYLIWFNFSLVIEKDLSVGLPKRTKNKKTIAFVLSLVSIYVFKM